MNYVTFSSNVRDPAVQERLNELQENRSNVRFLNLQKGRGDFEFKTFLTHEDWPRYDDQLSDLRTKFSIDQIPSLSLIRPLSERIKEYSKTEPSPERRQILLKREVQMIEELVELVGLTYDIESTKVSIRSVITPEDVVGTKQLLFVLSPESFPFIISTYKKWEEEMASRPVEFQENYLPQVRSYFNHEIPTTARLAKLVEAIYMRQTHQLRAHYLLKHLYQLMFESMGYLKVKKKVEILCPVMLKIISLYNDFIHNRNVPHPQQLTDLGEALKEDKYFKELKEELNKVERPATYTKEHIQPKSKKKTSKPSKHTPGISSPKSQDCIPGPSSQASTGGIEPPQQNEIVSEICSRPQLLLARRVERWQVVDPELPKAQMDRFSDGKERKYLDLGPEECYTQLGFHLVPIFVDRLMNHANSREYKISTDTGYGCYAILRMGDQVHYGAIRYGFGKKNKTLCIHKKFDPISMDELVNKKSAAHMKLDAQVIQTAEEEKDLFYSDQTESTVATWGNWEENIAFDTETGVIKIAMKKPDESKVYYNWEIYPYIST